MPWLIGLTPTVSGTSNEGGVDHVDAPDQPSNTSFIRRHRVVLGVAAASALVAVPAAGAVWQLTGHQQSLATTNGTSGAPSKQLSDNALPLAVHMEAFNVYAQAHDAANRHILACLGEETVPDAAGAVLPEWSGDFGVVSMDHAKKFGLGLSDADRRSMAAVAKQEELLELADPQAAAECAKDLESWGPLIMQLQPHFDLIDQLRMQAQETAKGTESSQQALAAWQQCMADQGFTSDDPLALLVDPNIVGMPDESGNMPVTPESIRAAVADVDCKETSGLLTVWSDESRKAERELIANHDKELNQAVEAAEKLRAAVNDR